MKRIAIRNGENSIAECHVARRESLQQCRVERLVAVLLLHHLHALQGREVDEIADQEPTAEGLTCSARSTAKPATAIAASEGTDSAKAWLRRLRGEDQSALAYAEQMDHLDMFAAPQQLTGLGIEAEEMIAIGGNGIDPAIGIQARRQVAWRGGMSVLVSSTAAWIPKRPGPPAGLGLKGHDRARVRAVDEEGPGQC